MKINEIFKGVKFGKMENIGVSVFGGICIKNDQEEMVAYDRKTGDIINVEALDTEIKDMVYSVPSALKDIKEGDAILYKNRPVFVKAVSGHKIKIIDIVEGEEKDIISSKSIFGFDFVTKLITLLDNSNMASNDNPFGNLLPLMLLDKSKEENGEEKSDIENLLPLMLMGNNSGNMNNLLPLLLMKDSGSNKDTLMTMLLMNSMNGNNNKSVAKAEEEENPFME